MVWEPGAVSFRSLHGHYCNPDTPGHVIWDHRFVSPLVPAAGQMQLHLNLWLDDGLAPTNGQDVEIIIKDIVRDCAFTDIAPLPTSPDVELTAQPNPAGEGMDLAFAVPRECRVVLSVSDVTGRHLETLLDAVMPSGEHAVPWNSDGATPGIYFVQMTVGERQITRRVVLLK